MLVMMIDFLSPPNPQTGKGKTRQGVSGSLDRGYWTKVADVLNRLEKNSKLWSLSWVQAGLYGTLFCSEQSHLSFGSVSVLFSEKFFLLSLLSLDVAVQ